MPNTYDTVRVETLLALALSRQWPKASPPVEPPPEIEAQEIEADSEPFREGEFEEGLPDPLLNLGTTDRLATAALLRRYQELKDEDRARWLVHQIRRIRAATPERNQRFEKDIHTSQIIELLRKEPPRVQSLIAGFLASPQREVVADALGIVAQLESGDGGNLARQRLAELARRAFFSQFVPRSDLQNPNALDLLSGVELARLIRLLGVRETAIACQGIAAVETVTAFLKRFSAEDAHAIVSHLAVLKDIEPQRIDFAEALARRAISEHSDLTSAMLDRIGLALLAIVLDSYGNARRRHIAQKLPLEAARELDDLLTDGPYWDREMARRIVEETESLAANLHHLPAETREERRGVPAV
jgi:hypothetical protein